MESSPTTLPPFRATVAGVEVLYLEGHPDSNAVKHEIAVLRSFIVEWNAGQNAMDNIHVLNVRGHNHVSDNTPKEPQHLTVSIMNSTQWNSDPKEYKITMHVYAKNSDPSQGYDNAVQQKNKGNVKANDGYTKKIMGAYDNHVAALDLA